MHEMPERPIPEAAHADADLIRTALRDGLRDEAAPISRRLAEVKGLQNNAIGRLARLESTLESERNARVDDLELLVDLLSEGWRSLNNRLDRIEHLLALTLVPAEALAGTGAVSNGAVSNGAVSNGAGPANGVTNGAAGLYRLPTAESR